MRVDISSFGQFNISWKGFNTQEINRQKRQLSQYNETLNDFTIGNNSHVGLSENENLEKQTNGQPTALEIVDKVARQNQVIEKNIDDQITRAVSTAVLTVENYMPDAILTAVVNMIVRSLVWVSVKWMTGLVDGGSHIRMNILGMILIWFPVFQVCVAECPRNGSGVRPYLRVQ